MNPTFYVSTGPPWWTYIFAVPLVAWMICAFFSSMQPGRKVKIYKIVNGRQVRDYQAEAELRKRT